MEEIEFESGAKLAYEYVPVGGGNAFVSTRYRTFVYLVSNGAKYDMGYEEGKLDPEEIKQRWTDIMQTEQHRKYGQQGTLLRSELKPRRGTVSERTAQATLRSRYKGLV